MSNTPYTLACQSQGRVQHGSILSGNLRPTRVTSQWKSTYSDFTDYSASIFSTSYDQKVNSIGVYATVDKKLTNRLKLTFGGRFEHEERKLNDFQTSIIYPTYTLRASGDRRQEMNAPSGKAALNWQISNRVLAYASIARGVKSGGFTTYNSSVPQQSEPFNPEKLVAYELGLKTDLLHDTLQVDVAGFYYNYLDKQMLDVVSSGTTRAGAIINIPKSHIYGGEAEIHWKPFRGLTIAQSLAWKRGQYDKFLHLASVTQNATTGAYSYTYEDRSGMRLPLLTFDYKGSIAYAIPIRGWEVEPEFNFNHLGEPYSTSDAARLPSYWLANLNIGVSPPDSRLRATFWVHNLFNAEITETRNRWISATTASVHPPRTIGVRLSYNY